MFFLMQSDYSHILVTESNLKRWRSPSTFLVAPFVKGGRGWGGAKESQRNESCWSPSPLLSTNRLTALSRFLNSFPLHPQQPPTPQQKVQPQSFFSFLSLCTIFHFSHFVFQVLQSSSSFFNRMVGRLSFLVTSVAYELYTSGNIPPKVWF